MKNGFNLSWKQRLSSIIVITLVGLVIVVGSAFKGLASVNSSVDMQNASSNYRQAGLQLSNALLSLEGKIGSLTVVTVDGFIGELAELTNLSEDLVTTASMLDIRELEDYSQELTELTSRYRALQTERLNAQKNLGFTLAEGELANVVTALIAIKEISFSLIDGPFTSLSNSQTRFLTERSQEPANLMNDALMELEAIIIDMDWQENMVGLSIIEYRKVYDRLMVLIEQDRVFSEQINQNLTELNSVVIEQEDYLSTVVAVNVANQAHETSASASRIMILAALIVGLIILVSLIFVVRQLNEQLSVMQKFLGNIADGDLSKRLPITSNKQDEFNHLRAAANRMLEDVSAVIVQVVDGNADLMTLRSELENALIELESSSNQVENKSTQSTTATQQISVAVDSVAKTATDVGSIAQDAATATENGMHVVNACANSILQISELIDKTSTEVGSLAKSGTEMLGIIDVINSLADQTNLLALNAAIESARAGEAGRGFAVVADEVRALAQKTVNATSGIGEIIDRLNKQTTNMGTLMSSTTKLATEGQENANNAKQTIESIGETVKSVSIEMDQVVVAVDEIAHTSNEIAQQVGSISGLSDNNRQTRLRLTDQGHKLSEQVETLDHTTKRFKLPDPTA